MGVTGLLHLAITDENQACLRDYFEFGLLRTYSQAIKTLQGMNKYQLPPEGNEVQGYR